MATRKVIKNGVGQLGEPPLLSLERTPGGEERVSAALISLLNLFQQTIIRKINGAISWGNGDHATQTGNIQGQWIEVVTPSADVEFVVDHGLGRVPAGVVKMRANKACQIYDSNIGGWNDRKIYLKCDVDTATIRVALV